MTERQPMGGHRRSSFIVRIDRDEHGGGISGVIEHVRTRAKEPFRGVEAIGALNARMVKADSAPSTSAPPIYPGDSKARVA